MDEWIDAMKTSARCEFVPAEETLEHPFWTELEGLPDPEHAARPAVMKLGIERGLRVQETANCDVQLMEWVRELGNKAIEGKHLTFTHHLGERDIVRGKQNF